MKGNNKTIIIILAVIAVLLIFGILFVGCNILNPTPVPTELVPTGTQPPPPVTDTTWDRVKTSLKLVVGTSADYPPFEYYTPQNQIDGFDMALIRAIGTQLGLQVEIHDYAFESLGSALQAGEIDVVIAAISTTPERSEYADFSNVYYVAEEAVLASQSSPINSITSADEIVNQRVGVQNKSVYQAWFQNPRPWKNATLFFLKR